METMERIREFLGQHRLAIVGVSQKPAETSRALFREFRERGYDAVPVNPAAQEIDGQRCFARVQEIQPPVAAVLLMTSPAVTESVVRDCAEAGIPRVWMFRGAGVGAVSAEAVSFCESKGISVIPGRVSVHVPAGGRLVPPVSRVGSEDHRRLSEGVAAKLGWTRMGNPVDRLPTSPISPTFEEVGAAGYHKNERERTGRCAQPASWPHGFRVTAR